MEPFSYKIDESNGTIYDKLLEEQEFHLNRFRNIVSK